MMPQRYYCCLANVPAPPTSLELKEMGGAAIVPQRGGRGWRSCSSWPYSQPANCFLWLRRYRVCVGLAFMSLQAPFQCPLCGQTILACNSPGKLPLSTIHLSVLYNGIFSSPCARTCMSSPSCTLSESVHCGSKFSSNDTTERTC